MTESPRQELRDYVESGNLRRDLEHSSQLNQDAIDLLVRIARDYCAPRRRKSQ